MADPAAADRVSAPVARAHTVSGGTRRLLGGLVASIAGAVLLLAAGLDASPEGHGTHTQLGLPACNWVSLMNRPCPTCGMTTSFTHAADGSLASAAAAQPAGTLLAIITAALAWGGVHTLVSGVALGPLLGGLLRARVIWVALGLLLAAWVYKIATWGV